MVESIHDRIKREREASLQDAATVRDYRLYAEGKHRSTISAAQKQLLGPVVGHEFADNVCDLVLSTAASRLELTGFRVEVDAVQTFLDELFTKNQIADFSFDVHYRTIRDGNHAVGLRWVADDRRRDEATDPDADVPETRGGGRVTLHHEPWWDGKETGVFVAYDEAGQPAYAVKDFSQMLGDPPRARRRRTIYFPDHLERYLMEGQGWQPYPLPGESPDGIVPLQKRDGSPLGIPILHFANGRFGTSPYGASDLAGGILGLQDEINDIQRDITAAARLTAFQMIAATGVDESQGKLKVGPGQVLGSPNPAARIGAIPAGDMAQILSAHAMKLATVSRNTQTPLHLITGGDWPSGSALIRAEMPLVSRVQRMAKTIGPAWATVAHRSTEMANVFGALSLDEEALIVAVFAPPEKLDAMALVEIDKAKADVWLNVGLIDDPVLLKKTGLLTDDEITAVMAERTTRGAAAVAEF